MCFLSACFESKGECAPWSEEPTSYISASSGTIQGISTQPSLTKTGLAVHWVGSTEMPGFSRCVRGPVCRRPDNDREFSRHLPVIYVRFQGSVAQTGGSSTHLSSLQPLTAAFPQPLAAPSQAWAASTVQRAPGPRLQTSPASPPCCAGSPSWRSG